MTKLNLSDLTSLTNEAAALSTLANNNAAIKTAVENTLSRDGTSPNQMQANIDMNSNRISNLPLPVADTEPARLIDVRAGITGPTGPAAWLPPTAWLTATAYTVGPPASVVTQGGETYVCLVSHTSGTFATDLAASKWVKIATKGADGANGAISISGTPTAGQFAIWTNATTEKGVSITGLVKGNGASDPTAAVSGTDYAPATSGSAILKANGSGGFANVGITDTLSILQIEVGNASDTTIARAAAGVISVEGVNLTPNIPQNSQSVAYTTVLADANTHILHPVGDNNARTFTIAANASVAYPIGTTLTFVNKINTVTIAINTDTLTFAGAGTTGSRTLAANGMATALKITSTEWIISGSGLT